MSSPTPLTGSGSGSRPKVNLRSTAVKRIMQEASELSTSDKDDDFVAAPLETDIFEWHVTMRGTAGSEYEDGLYHLRILLPTTYPMSAPDIIFMTPNGRFELGKKVHISSGICIDGLTSFHAGSWQPAWGVRTAVLGLRSFWMQGGEALSAIGALDQSKDERKRLAQLSHEWECPQCGKMKDQIPDAPSTPQSELAPKEETTSSTPAGLDATFSQLETEPEERLVSNGPQASREAVDTPTPLEDLSTSPLAPVEEAQPAATPTISAPAQTHVHPPRTEPPIRQAPMWIDALIVVGLAILVTMLYRKIGNSSNLIETVSL